MTVLKIVLFLLTLQVRMSRWQVVVVAMLMLLNISKCDWVEISQEPFLYPADSHRFISKASTDVEAVTTKQPTLDPPDISDDDQMPPPTTETVDQVASSITKIVVDPDVSSTTNSTNEVESTTQTITQMESATEALPANVSIDSSRSRKDSGGIEDLNFDDPDQGFSYARFLPFMNDVQSTLMRHAHKTTTSKIEILQNLRDKLLYDIKQRITSLWKPKSSRQSRHYDDKEEHLDFPSNEGALMTISFLTFAVLLIKLVLGDLLGVCYCNFSSIERFQHLIYTLKNGHNGNGSFLGRKRRSVTEEELRILDYIDKYRFK